MHFYTIVLGNNLVNNWLHQVELWLGLWVRWGFENSLIAILIYPYLKLGGWWCVVGILCIIKPLSGPACKNSN